MIEQIILCAFVDIISLFALHMSLHMNAQKKYYKSFFYPAFAATWLLIGRLDSLKAQIAFTILNLIAYFVIHSLSTKKELQNTVDTYNKNKEETK